MSVKPPNTIYASRQSKVLRRKLATCGIGEVPTPTPAIAIPSASPLLASKREVIALA